MAIIKGSKYRSSGDDFSRKKGHKEEQARKGGLIKARKTSFLSPSASAKRSSPSAARRGKILKAKWTAILKDATKEEKKSEFVPASFVTQPGGIDGRGTPKNVVMIPSKDVPPKAEEPKEEADFKVEEPEPTPNVDVEAIIAEAEQKGRERAAKIIEHAQAEAKKLIEQAKIYGETAKAEAHQEGFKQGKEDGYKAGLAEFTALMEEAKNLFNQLINERRKILESIEPELAKLSISIAEKIIGEEIKTNPDVVISVVRQAMSKLKSREEVTIKVNPDDLDHVRANRDVFATLVEGVKELEIIADPRVDRGGCLIETNLGNTDARIKTQLAAIELAFKNVSGSAY